MPLYTLVTQRATLLLVTFTFPPQLLVLRSWISTLPSA